MWKKMLAGCLAMAVLLMQPAEAAPEALDRSKSVPVTEQEREAMRQADEELRTGSPFHPPLTDPGVDVPAGSEAAGLAENTAGPQHAAPVEALPAETVPTAEPISKQDEEEKQKAALESRKIVINLAIPSLALYEGSERIRLYPIAPGTVSTPTPTGYFEIRSKDVNPTWIDPKDPKHVIPSGEDNPLGYRWMEFYAVNYGIHGTNKPESIGHFVSNGCIRMHEKDVEALFDLVEIGTPVEITYNRVVVEKTPDDTVVYYIYPDSYGWQNLTVSMINQWLAGYGIQAFEPDAAIEQKLNASDGKPTYLGKAYPVTLDGNKTKIKAVYKDGNIYLPAMELAETLQTDLGWDAQREKLITAYSETPGIEKKNLLFLNAKDVAPLFRLMGSLQPNHVYALQSIPQMPVQPVPIEPVRPDSGQKADDPDRQALQEAAEPKASAGAAESRKQGKSQITIVRTREVIG